MDKISLQKLLFLFTHRQEKAVLVHFTQKKNYRASCFNAFILTFTKTSIYNDNRRDSQQD